MSQFLMLFRFPMFFSMLLLGCAQLSAGWFSRSKASLEKPSHSRESAALASSEKFFRRHCSTVRELRPGYNTYANEANILNDCFEGLFTLDATGKVCPGVAERWEALDRGLKFRFFLRKNAYHSDGQRVTAHDFISNLHRCAPDFSQHQPLHDAFETTYVDQLGIKNARDILAKKCSIEEIGIRALDDFTIEMELEKPVRAQRLILALARGSTLLVPTRLEYFQAMQDLTAVSPKALLPSNGPFYIENVSYNEKIELKRNPYYWNKSAVKIEGVRYVLADPAPAEQAARWCNGELDYLVGKPEVKAEVAKMQPNCIWDPLQAYTYYFFSYKPNSSLSKDRELRKIFAMILDRDYIKKVALESPETTVYGILSPHYEGAAKPTNPKWSEEALSIRWKRASQCLKEKGYSAQNPLTIRLIHYLPVSKEAPFANHMAALSKQIPELKIITKKLEANVLLALVHDLKETSYDLALHICSQSAPRPLNAFRNQRSENRQKLCHCQKAQETLPDLAAQIASLGKKLSSSSELQQSFARLEQALESDSLTCLPWCPHSQDYEVFVKRFYIEPAAVKKAIYAEQNKFYTAFEKKNDESCVLDEYDLILCHLGADSDLSDQDERSFEKRLDEIVQHELLTIPLATNCWYSTQTARVQALEPKYRDPSGRLPSSAVELQVNPSKSR